MSSTYVGTGIAGLPLTYTLENDTDYDRTEVVGIHAGFPDGFNSIDEAELIERGYFYLDGGRETIGFGQKNNTTPGWLGDNAPSATAIRWDLTIPWVASLNAITAGSGNIQPGSCKLTYYTENNVYVEVYDTPINATTGKWLYSYGGVSFISSSLINYTTGAISITFASNRRPWWGDINKAQGRPIRMTYKFANPVKYPTQWTVTRTWPSGRVRQAKAWIGQSSGDGMFVSKKIQTHTVYGDAAGTQVMPASALWPTPIDQLKEYTRVYLRFGVDDGTVNSDLPTYTLHSDTADALNSSLSSLSSQVVDHNNNVYYSRTLSSSEDYEVHVMEDPANNSGKGWMKVYQKRGYHTASTSISTFGTMTRDFLSLTSYFYVPHNNRFFDVETRLGNDYQGYDPLDHTISVNLGTGNGSTRTFSTTVTNSHQVIGGVEDGPMRQGRVWIFIDGVPVAHDRKGDGVLRRITGNNIVNLSSTQNNYGSVNYNTGVISVTVPGVDSAPGSGKAVTCTYVTRALRIGTISGTGTISAYALPSSPNQHGVYVRVGNGSTPLFEAWDAGGSFGAATGYLAPLRADSVVTSSLVTSANLTASESGTLATNLHPGSVEFYTSTSTNGISSTVFCRDDGNGGLTGRGVSSGTINYATGAYSITFSSTPTAGLNLYANYKRNTSALPISGQVDYSSGEVTVTLSSAVPSNTPVFVTYVRNENSLKTIDPNAYPLGCAGMSKWLLLFNNTYLDIDCEAAPSYAVYKGATFFTLIGPSYNRDNVTSSSSPEYLHDGASLCRVFKCFAKNNATTADNNNWTARKYNPLTAIPTIDCYNATTAFGLFEGTLANITPEQAVGPFYTTARAFTEDLGRKLSSAAIIYPFPYTQGPAGDGVNTSLYSNRSKYTAVDSWNNGDVYSTSSWPGKSPRTDFGWIENWYNGVNAGGAGRVGQDFSGLIYQTQAWQAVRFIYHASLFPMYRPGAVLWNIAMRSKWEDRAYRNYIGTGPSSGMVANITGGSSVSAYGQPFGVDYLGRAHKAGWSSGKAGVTNGSTTFTLAAQFTGDGVLLDFGSRWSYYGYTSSYTVTGTSRVPGLRRAVFQGSMKVYEVTNLVYNQDLLRWEGTLDSAYDGSTNAAAVFSLINDVRPGLDSPFVRTNPSIAVASRLGCGEFSRQHSIEGDSSSHQAAFTSFDIWCVTGSWMAWDVVRHHADWNMASCKEWNNWSFQQDQMRTSAWHLRAVVCGYDVTKALTGRTGFGFLTDSLYGGAADRYAEWIRIRMTQWVNYGAKGEMDPSNTITAGGRKKIVDLRVSSTSDKADWYSCAKVGSTSPTYGGTGSLTECQRLFTSTGYHYVSIWEIGYLAPWAFAAYRLFRNDPTIIDMPDRGETNKTFGELITRVFDAYSNFFVDYAYIDRNQDSPQRGAPGFYITSLANTPGYTGWGPNFGPRNSYWAIPTQWIANPVNANGDPKPSDVLPQFVNKSVTFSEETRSDDYVAVQVYWLRGSAFEYDNVVNEPIDRIGYPLNNSGWVSRGFSSDSNTTFELSLGPNDSAWHFPGIPFQGNALIPGASNDTSNELYNGTRAPLYPESFNVVGISHDNETPLSTISFLFTSQVARFHPDPAIRGRAGTIMNKYLTQAIAMSLITNNNYYETGITTYNKGVSVELNHYSGPITGSYPYVTDTGIQPVDRWWDTAYRSRRRLYADPSHSDLSADTSVFTINLSDYGIDDKSLMDSTEDVRVVLQYSDGSYALCESVVRQEASGDFIMFVKMPIDLPDGQGVSDQSTSVAWYVYYTNISAGPASWQNVNSPQAPYSSDTVTRILWNNNGNYATEASSNNWNLTTITGLDPDFVDSPVGGGVGFTSANIDTAYSSAASGIAKTSSSSYLGGAFTVEFYVNLAPKDAAKDSTLNYGIFSVADDSVFPMLSYIENSTGNLLFLSSLGSSGGSYTLNGCSITGQYKKVASGPNGSITDFGFTLDHTNVLPGSVRVCLNDGSNIDGRDDGNGTISGTGVSNVSTINYSTGAVDLTFTSAPSGSSFIVVYYSTVASPNRLQLGSWNHVRFDYNGSRFAMYLNGTQVGTVTASGQIQPLPANTTTVANLGSLFSPGILWTARSNIKLAEFRISSSSRGAPAWSTTSLNATLLTEETQVVSGTASAPCTAFLAPLRHLATPGSGMVAIPDLTAEAVGAGYLVNGYNSQSSASVEASLLVVDTNIICDAEASIAIDKSVSATVRTFIARILESRAGVAGMVALSGSSSAQATGTLTYLRGTKGECEATIAVPDITSGGTCVATISLGLDSTVSAPGSGYVLRALETSSPAAGTISINRSSQVKVNATLQVEGKPVTVVARASILVEDRSSQASAAGTIADIYSVTHAGLGTISVPSKTTAACTGNILVEGSHTSSSPCEASVVVPDVSTYVQAFASISVQGTSSSAVTASIRSDDVLSSASAGGAVSVEDNAVSVAASASLISQPIESGFSADATVVLAKSSTAPATGSIIVASQMSAPGAANISVDGYSASAPAVATIAVNVASESTAAGYIATQGKREADVQAFVKLEDKLLTAPVTMTLAVTRSSSTSSIATLAVTRSRNAVCRASLVLPLEQNLNASGIDFTEGDLIND